MQTSSNDPPRGTLIVTLAAIFMTGYGIYNVIGAFPFLLIYGARFGALISLPVISLLSSIGMISAGVGLLNRRRWAYPAAILVNFWDGLYGVLLTVPGAFVAKDTSGLIFPVITLTVALLLIADRDTREQFRRIIIVNGQVVYPILSISMLLVTSYLIATGIVSLITMTGNLPFYITGFQFYWTQFLLFPFAVLFCKAGFDLLRRKPWAFRLALVMLVIDVIMAIFLRDGVNFAVLGYTAINNIPNQVLIYSVVLSIFIMAVLVIDRNQSRQVHIEPQIIAPDVMG